MSHSHNDVHFQMCKVTACCVQPIDIGRLLPACRQHTQRAPKVTAPMASNNTAGIAQARKLVEQLKMEANVDRMKVSGQASKPQVVDVFSCKKKRIKSVTWGVFCVTVAVRGK